ncbi:MAG: glycosyl hydrolase [Chthonomonadales bacterium]
MYSAIRILAAAWLLVAGPPPDTHSLALQWSNLEGVWIFRTDPSDEGEKAGWQLREAPEDGWRPIRVPGYWEEQGVTDPRPGRPPKPKDGMPWTDYDGVAWYRLHVTVPASWRGQNLVLFLGSVDDEDRTFFNGRLVGATGPGVERAVTVQRRYTIPAGLVRFGGENVLAVRVFDGGGPGGIVGPLVSLLPQKAVKEMQILPSGSRPLKERFANPPADARILKIIHSWPDGAANQEALIQSLIAQGFGGVVCNVSFTDYLVSEAKWQEFVHAVKAAKAAGMALWLYDEKGYPSGVAGGLTLQGHPELEAQGLLVASADSKGGAVTMKLPPGEMVLAKAFPQKDGAIQLSGALDLARYVRDGTLQTDLPRGDWRLVAVTRNRLYEGTHAALSLADKLPYINLLDPQATDRFLALTHQRYAEHLGSNLGRYFQSTFTDEPSLMSMFLRPMPWSVLPWAPNLAHEFLVRRGRPLEPLLPALIADAGPGTAKARYDFWRTVGDLVSENYFGRIQAWCHAHGIKSGGHLLYEEPLLHHVPLYGNFFQCARRLDAPSIDCLTSVPAEVPWFIARLISSAGELEGHTQTMCETSDFAQVYRPSGDTRPVYHVSEDEIRGTCNRLMFGGINTITSYYTFNGLTASQLQRINRYVGRCATMLRGGHQVADIALLYPVESVWPRYVPSSNGPTTSPDAARVDYAYRMALDGLFAAHRDFTFVDSATLAQASVERGVLRYRELQWRVVVLPGADTLPVPVWRKLLRFVKTGGIVIAVGTLPANSDVEFPCAEVRLIGRKMFGEGSESRVQTNASGGSGIYLARGSESLLATVLASVLEPDVAVPPASPIHATHRRIGDHDVYFVINDSPKPWRGRVRVAAKGQGELWDPATGGVTPLPMVAGVSLDLPAYGGVFLRFPGARLPRRRRLQTGALPGITAEPIPSIEPQVGKGEYVEAQIQAFEAPWAQGRRAWRAPARLTRSGVDTFLFLNFPFAPPADLSGADGLALDTWVPPSQHTPSELLVILHERDGGQYLARTGRLLSEAGSARSIVLFNQFRPAGWAHDPNGRLDLDQIVGISIGWGGYLGAQGEQVEFAVAAPEAVHVGRPR